MEKTGQGSVVTSRAGLSLLQPGLYPGREHALLGLVGDSESGHGAGGGGPHMAAAAEGAEPIPQDR